MGRQNSILGGSLQRRWQWAQTLVPSGVEAGGPPLGWEDVTEMGESLQFEPLSFKEIKLPQAPSDPAGSQSLRGAAWDPRMVDLQKQEMLRVKGQVGGPSAALTARHWWSSQPQFLHLCQEGSHQG